MKCSECGIQTNHKCGHGFSFICEIPLCTSIECRFKHELMTHQLSPFAEFAMRRHGEQTAEWWIKEHESQIDVPKCLNEIKARLGQEASEKPDRSKDARLQYFLGFIAKFIVENNKIREYGTLRENDFTQNELHVQEHLTRTRGDETVITITTPVLDHTKTWPISYTHEGESYAYDGRIPGIGNHNAAQYIRKTA